MKIAALIARLLLGLMFFFLGLDTFIHFIHAAPPTEGLAGAFIGSLMKSHYIHYVAAFELLGGLFLLADQFVPLGLVFLGPVIVNILIFHFAMDLAGIVPGLVITLLWLLVAYRYRSYFLAMCVRKAVPTEQGQR